MSKAIFILARQGSKRIPEKNFKDFCGKPLIHYTIETARQLGKLIEAQIYLMTDFDKIKQYADGKVDFIVDMPEKYGKDKHDLKGSLKYLNRQAKANEIILLQPTSPIRDVILYKHFFDIYSNSDAKAAVTVYQMPDKYFYSSNQNPLNFNMLQRDGNGCKKSSIYFENGGMYIFEKSQLNRKHILITSKRMLFVDKFGIDLDHPMHWEQGENVFRQILKLEHGKC